MPDLFGLCDCVTIRPGYQFLVLGQGIIHINLDVAMHLLVRQVVVDICHVGDHADVKIVETVLELVPWRFVVGKDAPPALSLLTASQVQQLFREDIGKVFLEGGRGRELTLELFIK